MMYNKGLQEVDMKKVHTMCLYEIVHSIQVLHMHLNIQVLGTCMSGIYIVF